MQKFSTWYITRHYYVDIHPPLAKLAFAGVLWALGFKGAQEDNVRWWVSEKEGGFIGTKDWMLLYDEKYGSMFLPLRRLSATLGVIFIAVTYLTARAIGLRRVAATFAAWMAMCELVILVQSRAILCDIFLYLFNMATIGASFASMRAGLTERQRINWLLVTGVLLGCAMSVKLTALGTVALVGVHQAMSLFEVLPKSAAGWNKLAGRGVCRASCILLPATVIFFGLWTVHLEILKYSGQGDNFMNADFRATLITPPSHNAPAVAVAADACPNHANTWSDCGFAGITPEACEAKGCCWDPSSPRAWCYHRGELARPTMSWVAKMKETLRATWANNNGGAVMIHPFMSEWYEWPIMDAKSVPFSATTEGGQIKAMGNPAVWWGAFGNFVLCTVFAAGWLLLRAGKACARPAKRPAAKGGVPAGLVPAGGAAPAPEAPFVPPQGWFIPFVTLWCGYILNLVPYMGISRSKFVYHYIPALMVAVLLTALALEGVWAWAGTATGSKRSAAALITLACYGLVTAGFWYWGLPYAYGIRLDYAQNQARQWNHKW